MIVGGTRGLIRISRRGELSYFSDCSSVVVPLNFVEAFSYIHQQIKGRNLAIWAGYPVAITKPNSRSGSSRVFESLIAKLHPFINVGRKKLPTIL